ncbi:MAG: hypothetical protein LBQ56_01805, partial [Synergistaceae bacterium]|nr:hypothetical protein [Synergistaceae bacterium]
MRIGVDLGGHTLITARVSDAGEAGALPMIERALAEDTPTGRGARDVIAAMARAISELASGSDVG